MPRMWPDLCGAIEREDMAEDSRFDTREARRGHRKECNSMIAEAMAKFTTEEMLKRFEASDIPSGPVFTIDQAFDDPQVQHMGLAKELSSEKMGDFKLLSQAFRLNRTPTDNWTAIPEYGENTEEVLAEFGFSSEMEAFALQFCHGLGVALHERPIVSRLVSLERPQEIKEGMVFALETYCPASDGFSAARIEEEVVVTADGCKVITLFPAEELPIANPY